MNDYLRQADQYITELLHLDDAALKATQQSVVQAWAHDIGVSPVQGNLLMVLAKMCGARKILEVGTFFGYSTQWLARALPADGQLITIEYDPQTAAHATENFKRAGLEHMVKQLTGDALDIMPGLKAEAPFDLIFIDANKEPYAEYFELALRLSKPGTVIIADNVIRHLFDVESTPEKKEGVARFNRLLASCEAVDAAVFQWVGEKTPDGMAIALVK